MGTTCQYEKEHQVFAGEAQFISVGNITGNVTVANTLTETALFSYDLPAGLLDNTGKQFKITLAGLIGSGGTQDVTFTLRYGTTDVLEVITVSLPNEANKAFRLEYEGRVHTAGASGKIVAYGKLENEATGMADIKKATAAAGVNADTTIASTLNVTAQWDIIGAAATLTALTGKIEFYN